MDNSSCRCSKSEQNTQMARCHVPSSATSCSAHQVLGCNCTCSIIWLVLEASSPMNKHAASAASTHAAQVLLAVTLHSWPAVGSTLQHYRTPAARPGVSAHPGQHHQLLLHAISSRWQSWSCLGQPLAAAGPCRPKRHHQGCHRLAGKA